MIGFAFIAACALVAVPVSSPVVDFQRAYNGAYTGRATAVEAQRSLNLLMGWQAESASGAVAFGSDARILDAPVAKVQRETHTSAPIERVVRVDGSGPRLEVRVPVVGNRPYEVYRREAPGMYVRLEQVVTKSGNTLTFMPPAPGDYVVREKDAASAPEITPPPFLDFTPASSAPEAKAAWRFYRAAPERVTGAIPLVLLHGMGNDRWKDFIDWAANSSEAEAFRATFQIWNYQQPITGVNAAIGYSREYPGFDESIVAYLARFIQQATETGVETDGVVYRFPASGLIAMLAHSQGGLKARAFLVNYPDYAERVVAVVALSSPLTGSPWGTPEWLRHTVNRLGFSSRTALGAVMKAGVSDLALTGYFSTGRQSDLDMGWGDFDAVGGFGFPTVNFALKRFPRRSFALTLSPRDANQTGAREWPGIADSTFEPAQLLDTYCGGLDAITPTQRGALYMDKFILYGAYLDPALNNIAAMREASHTLGGSSIVKRERGENIGLRTTARLMGQVLCNGSDTPLGVFQLNDGFVPLQSQLMLDGTQTELIYETKEVNGWRVPVTPYRVRQDIVDAHTFANPGRVRIMPGYSHLDMTTGRYNVRTGHSELFTRVAEDLLAAVLE